MNLKNNVFVNRFLEIFEYRDMIYELVKRDLRGRYKASIFGYFWNLMNPMFQIVIYVIVFSNVFKTGLDRFYVYLIVGMLPWNFFADSLREGAGSIVYQADMAKKIYFPREVLTISAVTSRMINLLLSYILVIPLLVFSGIFIGLYSIVALFFALLAEYLFALGIALFLSAITVYLRDIEHITGVILMAWIWATPVVYAVDAAKGLFGLAIKLNPMTMFVSFYHDIFYYQRNISIATFGRAYLLAAIVLIIGEIVFLRLEKNFAEEL